MARELQKERGWSQAMIAKAFGVSRPAVTQWLGKTRQLTEGEVPATVIGADGRRYDGEAVSGRPSPRPPKSMWKPGGAAYNAVRVARNKLGSEPYGPLDTLAQAKLAQLIDDLIEAAENFRAAMAGHVPAVPAVEPAKGMIFAQPGRYATVFKILKIVYSVNDLSLARSSRSCSFVSASASPSIHRSISVRTMPRSVSGGMASTSTDSPPSQFWARQNRSPSSAGSAGPALRFARPSLPAART